ncbi:HAD-like protein [Astrocystis sublimbata]|nr:HAD-like protein [Astrocystis sublimbata]
MADAQSLPPAPTPRAAAASEERAGSGIKAVFFDFMGTCLDWHSTVVRALPRDIPEAARSRLALAWREDFFSELHARSRLGLAPEDIDVTHRRTLLRSIRDPHNAFHEHRHHFFKGSNGIATAATVETTTEALFPDGAEPEWPAVEEAVRSWHHMTAWDDVLPALRALKEEPGLELFVLANGTTRLQLDLVRSSGLAACFDMLFSSELLGVYKPSPAAYNRALALVGVRPDQAVMVAAHAYDLRAAKALGLHTVYVYRWTDDTTEDMGQVRRENENFLDSGGMTGLVDVIRATELHC